MDDYISRQATLEAIEVFLEKDAKIACLNLSVNDPRFSKCMANTMVLKLLDKLLKKYHPQMCDLWCVESGILQKIACLDVLCAAEYVQN